MSIEQLQAQKIHLEFMLDTMELDRRHERHIMERLTACIQLLEKAGA